jgi:hypothetical protein
MIVVQLTSSSRPSMILEAKTAKALRGIFNLARIENYAVNIQPGWSNDWVFTECRRHNQLLKSGQISN